MSAPAPTAPAVVRTIAGPLGTRRCLSTGHRYHWLETSRQDQVAYLGEAELNALGEVPATPGVRAALPQLLDASTARWPAVSTPTLLLDVLLDADGPDTSRLAGLGYWLATLHAQPLTGSRAQLSRRAIPAWRLAVPLVAQSADAAYRTLPLEVAPTITRLARRAGLTAELDHPCLSHGRFGAAMCAVERTDTVVLGWREAGIGFPRTDLAAILADLVELLAATGRPAADAVRATLDGYQSGRGRSLSRSDRAAVFASTADRIVGHLARRIAVGGAAGVAELLRRADAQLEEVAS
jgi:hypothetical protein